MARRNSKKGNFKFIFQSLGLVTRLIFRILPSVLIIAIVGFVFFGVRSMLYADPYFRVGRVTVIPSGILTSQEYEMLQSQLAGKSLLRVNLLNVASNLERNPKVKQAIITRVLPNQLKVNLVSRMPVFQIRFSQNGPLYLIGGDRMVLSVGTTPVANVAILEDFTTKKRNYTIGTLYQNPYFERLTEISEWVKHDPVLSTEMMAKMSVDALGNVIIILSDGVELRIGKEPQISETKHALLMKLLKTEERENLLYLDLRYQDIVVKKKF